MNKGEFIKAISDKTDFSQKDITVVLNSMSEVISETLSNGDNISLIGFGTFKVSKRAERQCRNPKNGETVIVPAKNVPVFKAGKKLKESIS